MRLLFGEPQNGFGLPVGFPSKPQKQTGTEPQKAHESMSEFAGQAVNTLCGRSCQLHDSLMATVHVFHGHGSLHGNPYHVKIPEGFPWLTKRNSNLTMASIE